jgi:hypothetical protein
MRRSQLYELANLDVPDVEDPDDQNDTPINQTDELFERNDLASFNKSTSTSIRHNSDFSETDQPQTTTSESEAEFQRFSKSRRRSRKAASQQSKCWDYFQ